MKYKNKIEDIFVGKSDRRTISLRERVWRIEIRVERFWEWLGRKKYQISALFILGIITIGLGWKYDSSFAKLADFYPTDALGTWKNPKNASGKPQVEKERGINNFNEENSAYFKSPEEELYLGQFVGEIPEKVGIKRVSLNFSWFVSGDYFVPNSENNGNRELSEADYFMEIIYTLDGKNWGSLAKINRENWASQNPTIPIKNQEDLSKLQIRFQAVPGFKAYPEVLLDSIWLEVEYEKSPEKSELSQEEIDKLPREKIVEEEIFEQSPNDFTAKEELEFKLKEENLFIKDLESSTDPPPTEILNSNFPKEPAAENNEEKSEQDFENSNKNSEETKKNGEVGRRESTLYFSNFILRNLFNIKKARAANSSILGARVLDASNNPTGIETAIEYESGSSKIRVIKPERSFFPGRYKLELEILSEDQSKVLVAIKDFTWGVLAINTNKSIYAPGEKANLPIAVLDEKGMMVCDARLTLEIKNPEGDIQTFRTEDGSIQINPECQVHDFTINPDYQTAYQVNGAGKYQMNLSAETQNGIFQIVDYFEARDSVPFIVERFSPTRIFPPKPYPVFLDVVFKQDFKGEIQEGLPIDFATSQNINEEYLGEDKNFKVYDEEKKIGDTKFLVWRIEAKKDEKITLAYQFDAPDISPQFYLAGPLQFFEEGKNIFEEGRKWQIASDQIPTQKIPGNGGIIYGSTVYHGWRQTLMPDDIGSTTFSVIRRSWVLAPDASNGLDANLTIPNIDVSGEGTNKLIVNTRWQVSDTSFNNLTFQICDWVSNTGVDNGTDSVCTGGGWRTLNFGKQTIVPAANNAMYWNHAFSTSTAGHGTPYGVGGPKNDSAVSGAGLNSMSPFEVFNGYFTDGSGNSIDTPLSNFVSSSNVKIRVISTVKTTSYYFAWDFLSVEPAVDPSLLPSGVELNGSGQQYEYNYAFASERATPVNHSVAGKTGGTDFFYKFSNARSYTGANAILVNYLGSHSTSTGMTGNDIYICNFATAPTGDCAAGDSSKWEKLNDTAWDPGTTNSPQHFIKYSASINNYISSSNQIFIRLKNDNTNTGYYLLTDYIRVTVGSVNNSAENSEITLGSLYSGSISTNSQTLDTTKSLNAGDVYQITSANVPWEYTPSDIYGADCTYTAGTTAVRCTSDTDDRGVSANLSFSVKQPENSTITGVRYANRYLSGNSSMTIISGIKDYTGNPSVGSLAAVTTPQLPQTNAIGSYLDVGSTNNDASNYTYSDGTLIQDPQNKLDNFNNRMNMRIRTANIASSGIDATASWDSAFISIRWMANSASDGRRLLSKNVPDGGTLVVGNQLLNGWKAMQMADDMVLTAKYNNLYSWLIEGDGTGIDANVTVPLELNGTGMNKIIVNTRWQTDTYYMVDIKFQICDWISSTGVDNGTDSACTGGGWRTLNFGKQDMTPGNPKVLYWNHSFNTSTASHGTLYKIGGPSNDSSVANGGMNSMPAFEVFDGKFADSSGNPISTPLSNFVSNDHVKIRVTYSYTGGNAFLWDFLSAEAIADTSLVSSGVNLGGSAQQNNYTYTHASERATAVTHNIAGKTGGIDAYYIFSNARIYTGANAILVNYMGSHSATAMSGNSIYIRNFSGGGSWEQLNASAWDPGSTNTPHHFIKYSASISNYISPSGEIWIRLTNGATNTGYYLRTNYIRVTVGSVNSSTDDSEITLGSLTAGSASTNTQSLDTTKTLGAGDIYQIDRGTVPAGSSDMYGYDCVGTASAGSPTMCAASSYGVATNLSMPVTQPAKSTITGIHYSARYSANTTTTRIQPGIKDFTSNSSIGSPSSVSTPQLPQTNILGGWIDVGISNIATSYNYQDGILIENPQNKIDTANNKMNMRIRTSSQSSATSGVTNWDSAFLSIKWKPGDIIISGSAKQYDQASNVSSGTVRVAVNGTIQPETGTISDGVWSISGVTHPYANDVITIFLDGSTNGTLDSSDAVAILKYKGLGDISNVNLFERHLVIDGGNSLVLSNSDLSLYDNSVSGDADIFFDVDSSGNFFLDNGNSFSDEELYVDFGSVYQPNSNGGVSVDINDIEINGTFTLDSNTANVYGSWDNNSIFTANTGTVNFKASSGTEVIDSSGASVDNFYKVILGVGSGNATWNLGSVFEVDDDLSINYGTLAMNGSNNINLNGDFSIGSSGLYTKGSGVFTFGSTTSTVSWSDSSSPKQDMGMVIIGDGAITKGVATSSDVKATSIEIKANSYIESGNLITLTGSGTGSSRPFKVSNNFVSWGTLQYSGTSNTEIESTSYYHLKLEPSGTGNPTYYFGTAGGQEISVQGTINIGGSSNPVTVDWDNYDPDLSCQEGFYLANGSTWIKSSSATITFQGAGSSSINDYNSSKQDLGNLIFNGSNKSSSTGTDIKATTITVYSGNTLDITDDTLTVTGTGSPFVVNSGGTFNVANSTFIYTGSGTNTNIGANPYNNLTLSPSSSTTYNLSGNLTDNNSITGNLIIGSNATLDNTAGNKYNMSIAGNWENNGYFTHNNGGTVTFNSGSTGKTIVTGGSGSGKTFYNVVFDNGSGGWTIQTNDMKVANDLAIVNVSDWALQSGRTLEINGTYSIANSETVSTTWTGSTLYLNSGTSYTVGTKNQLAENYATLQIGSNTDIRIWNSNSGVYTVDSSGSLCSQDHNNINGDLYIWGDFHTGANEYWSYSTDFDGVDLSDGNERQVDVRIDPAGKVTVDDGDTLNAVGTSYNRTTVDRQGLSNGYEIIISSGGTVNFNYSNLDHLDGNKGLDIQAGATVTSLDYNKFDNLVGTANSDDAFITVASSVIGSGTKIIAGIQFENTGGGAEFNVNRTGSDDTGYWNFDSSTGTFDGEDYDGASGSDEADPGMIRWGAGGGETGLALSCEAQTIYMIDYTLGDDDNYSIKTFSDTEDCTVSDNSTAEWSLTLSSSDFTGNKNIISNTKVKLNTDGTPDSSPTISNPTSNITETSSGEHSLDMERSVVGGSTSASGDYNIRSTVKITDLNNLFSESDMGTLTFTVQ